MPHTLGSGYETSLSSTAALILSHHIVDRRYRPSPWMGWHTPVESSPGQPNAVRDKLHPRLHPPDRGCGIPSVPNRNLSNLGRRFLYLYLRMRT